MGSDKDLGLNLAPSSAAALFFGWTLSPPCPSWPAPQATTRHGLIGVLGWDMDSFFFRLSFFFELIFSGCGWGTEVEGLEREGIGIRNSGGGGWGGYSFHA